jgi:hypothetical protein
VKYLIDNFSSIDALNYQRLYILLNDHVIPDIRYVQRTKTRNIPWSLVSNLDEILKKEFGDNYLLLFRHQVQFNFSVITEDFISCLKEILMIFFLPTKQK